MIQSLWSYEASLGEEEHLATFVISSSFLKAKSDCKLSLVSQVILCLHLLYESLVISFS